MPEPVDVPISDGAIKLGTESLGHYTYDEILGRVRTELDRLIEEKTAVVGSNA